MYGYVVPQKSTLRPSDFILYRSFYCGLCCQTGRLFGQFPRFTTNYDFTLLTALLHDYACADIVIEEHTCVLNPVKKKAVLQPNELLERIAAVNILLAYQKAADGIIDGDGAKYKAAKRMLNKPYAQAASMCGEADARIKAAYEQLRDAERAGVDSLDRAADPFASLMRDLPAIIIGKKTDDNMQALCYNVGKFVYLADALDDIADDFKHKRYNPFLAAFGNFKDRASFIADNKSDLEFCFAAVTGRAMESFYSMRFTQSYALLKNIICDGLPAKAEELLASTKKLKPPRI